MMRTALSVLLLAATGGQCCTIVAVGRKASADGSVMVSHSEDAEGAGDPRPRRIPAQDHKHGSERIVYATDVSYPKNPRKLGTIPQVPHTYAYLQTTYGMMNEKQLIMGESTASSISPIDAVKPSDKGGTAIFGIQSLSEVALERCATARCAVKLMGELAEKYGYYQDEGTPTGEALAVGDTKDIYLFHVLPDSTGKGAVWGAALVPEDHVAVIANMFTIRVMDLKKEDQFLASKNIESEAVLSGRWKKGEPLDFTRIFSAGEYGRQYYAGRRVWRGLSLLAPASNLPAEYNDLRLDATYPPWVPCSGVVPNDVFRVHRDYYKGTPYDLTKGLIAGPWGTPNRYLLADKNPLGAAFERPISIYRTVFSYVAQARGFLPDACGAVLWYGPHTAHGTLYTPIAMGVADIPPSLGNFALDRLDRNGFFWAFVAIQSLAEARFAWISAEVEAMQALLEKKSMEAQAAADRAYLKSKDVKDVKKAYFDNAAYTNARIWAFFDQLVMRYADGFIRGDKPSTSPGYIGYPKAWLAGVGYTEELPPEETGLIGPPTPLIAQMPEPDYVTAQLSAAADERDVPQVQSSRADAGAVDSPPAGSSLPALLCGIVIGAAATALVAAAYVRNQGSTRPDHLYAFWEPAAEA